jgi:hypothetical protein
MNAPSRPAPRGTSITRALHRAFVGPLEASVVACSDVAAKPLLLDLGFPNSARLRVYLYSLVHGAGERQRREYKVVLRTPGQPLNQYGMFDHSDGRFTIVAGYDATLDVFVLWDAVLHPRFKNGGNLQVRDEAVRTAAALGVAEQIRNLSSGQRELVLACQSSTLNRAIAARIASTGGLGEGECAGFLS